MKKMSDETAAAIFCFVWEFFFYIAVIGDLCGKSFGWVLFLVDTAVQITILYYDTKVDKLERQLKRTRMYLARLSADYTEYIRTHSTEIEKPGTTVTIIDMAQLLKRKLTKKKAA